MDRSWQTAAGGRLPEDWRRKTGAGRLAPEDRRRKIGAGRLAPDELKGGHSYMTYSGFGRNFSTCDGVISAPWRRSSAKKSLKPAWNWRGIPVVSLRHVVSLAPREPMPSTDLMMTTPRCRCRSC